MSMSTERTLEILQAYGSAVSSHGPYADFFADDVTFTVMNHGEVARGRTAVERRIADLHSAELKVRGVLPGPGKLVLEADFTGKDGVAIPYCIAFELAEDKLTAIRIYFAGQVPAVLAGQPK